MSEMSNGAPRYDTAFLPHNLFRASRKLGLTAGELEVLMALITHDMPDEKGIIKGEVWCSPRNGLHDLTGRPRNTLQRVLRSLAEKGAIKNMTPENCGGQGNSNVWRINYQELDWKFPPGKGPQFGLEGPQNGSGRATICGPNPRMESEKEDPPPQSTSPSPQPHLPAGLQTEEEEFPFLSPEHRSLLGDLRLSRAGWRMVDDTAPDLLSQALQHIESHRTEIEGAGFSREQRLGAILKGAFVLPEEPEPEPAKGNGSKMLFCSFCGTVYSGEGHECTEG